MLTIPSAAQSLFMSFLVLLARWYVERAEKLLQLR